MKNAKVTTQADVKHGSAPPELPPQPERALNASAAEKSVRKRSGKLKTTHARLLQKKVGNNSKPNRLACRYCGSEDLAPSFTKRRDRRCRKCFSKRYGSAARASRVKLKR
jgi:hypothetical protein